MLLKHRFHIKVYDEGLLMGVKRRIFRMLSEVMILEILCAYVVMAEEMPQQDKTVNSMALNLQSPSAILMEASTGTVLFEKNPDEIRSPASITKILTLLLIFEALEKGQI